MYTALAKYYDIFMQNTDYEKWTDYVCSFLGSRKSGVDMACGSAKFTLELKKRGYDIYGVDISKQMLIKAAQNRDESGLDVSFVLGDMAKFEFIKNPEFIIAMCDAVNYLKDPYGFFQNSYNALKQDGVLIFDISTEYKLMQIIGSNTYSDTSSDITYIWNNTLKKSYVDMDLTFFDRCGEYYKKSVEHQRQYIHKIDTLRSLLIEAGFKRINVYSGTTRLKPRPDTQRVHFTAYK